MTTIKGIVAVLLAVSPILAAAETVYKYQRPDGTLVYSDSPVRNAKLIGRLDLPPAPPAAALGEGDSPRRSASRPDEELRTLALDEAYSQIEAAGRALKKAEERQRQAVEPLAGERLGNAGGHSRLGPEYFARQRAIAAEVDAARADLDEAYRLRNDLRE